MASRIGLNGAIVRPPLIPRRQNVARATASRYLELTENSREAAENSAETTAGSSRISDEERIPPRVGLTRSQLRRAQELSFYRLAALRHLAGPNILPPNHIYTISYVVSYHYHQPWMSFGQGDRFHLIGLYANLDQAIDAALEYYRRQMNADGWECNWDQNGEKLYGNEQLHLRARREEGEADTETLTIDIKKIQHMVGAGE